MKKTIFTIIGTIFLLSSCSNALIQKSDNNVTAGNEYATVILSANTESSQSRTFLPYNNITLPTEWTFTLLGADKKSTTIKKSFSNKPYELQLPFGSYTITAEGDATVTYIEGELEKTKTVHYSGYAKYNINSSEAVNIIITTKPTGTNGGSFSGVFDLAEIYSEYLCDYVAEKEFSACLINNSTNTTIELNCEYMEDNDYNIYNLNISNKNRILIPTGYYALQIKGTLTEYEKEPEEHYIFGPWTGTEDSIFTNYGSYDCYVQILDGLTTTIDYQQLKFPYKTENFYVTTQSIIENTGKRDTYNGSKANGLFKEYPCLFDDVIGNIQRYGKNDDGVNIYFPEEIKGDESTYGNVLYEQLNFDVSYIKNWQTYSVYFSQRNWPDDFQNKNFSISHVEGENYEYSLIFDYGTALILRDRYANAGSTYVELSPQLIDVNRTQLAVGLNNQLALKYVLPPSVQGETNTILNIDLVGVDHPEYYKDNPFLVVDASATETMWSVVTTSDIHDWFIAKYNKGYDESNPNNENYYLVSKNENFDTTYLQSISFTAMDKNKIDIPSGSAISNGDTINIKCNETPNSDYECPVVHSYAVQIGTATYYFNGDTELQLSVMLEQDGNQYLNINNFDLYLKIDPNATNKTVTVTYITHDGFNCVTKDFTLVIGE